MARYLSSAEKKVIVTMGAFKSFLDETEKLWAELKRPKVWLKVIRKAQEWTDKTIGEMLRDLEAAEMAKIQKEIRKNAVYIRYRDAAAIEFERISKLDDTVNLKVNSMLTLAEQALCVCKAFCKLEGDMVNGCDLKAALIEADVEPFYTEVPEGVCPYKVTK